MGYALLYGSRRHSAGALYRWYNTGQNRQTAACAFRIRQKQHDPVSASRQPAAA